jgi:hypothetical protein
MISKLCWVGHAVRILRDGLPSIIYNNFIIIIDLFPLKGALSKREAPDIIYLLTGSADVIPWKKFRLQQDQAHLLDRRKLKGSNIIQTTKN